MWTCREIFKTFKSLLYRSWESMSWVFDLPKDELNMAIIKLDTFDVVKIIPFHQVFISNPEIVKRNTQQIIKAKKLARNLKWNDRVLGR